MQLKDVYLGLAALAGLILVIIVATTLTPGQSLQGNLALNPAAPLCSALNLSSIPSPLKSNQSAIIIVKPVPETWGGKIRISATGGILNDSAGNEGSIIETSEKILNYSGGEQSDRITVQAEGSGNEQCLGTLEIQGNPAPACTGLQISTDPSPLPPDQSAVITIKTVPENFIGSFLYQADSGRFQLTATDPAALGENTPTLVTTLKSVIYNGGKAGEKIRVSALGEKNSPCKDLLAIKEQ